MILTTGSLHGLAMKIQSGGLSSSETGQDFLDTLLVTLPPELQDSSLQELIDWLREQGESAMAGLVLPDLMPDSMVMADLPTVESDSADMLNWIISSRQNMAAEPGAEVAAGTAASGAIFDDVLAEGEDLQLDANSPLRVPVRHSEFGQAVGERLIWMVRNDSQTAKIRLDPPSLGPLEISVAVKDDRAAVLIHANHALTRELLDAEAPRLRDMLAEQGFAEVDVNVAREDTQQRQAGEQKAEYAALAFETDSDSRDEEQSELIAPRIKAGLVDQYV